MPDRTALKTESPEQVADEYERLSQKHARADERLAELQARLLLSEDEKVEEVHLKKLKLQLKDRMEALVRPRP